MKKKMLFSALCFVFFLLLIFAVTGLDVAAIGPGGTSIGLSRLNQAVRDAVGTHMGLYRLTQLLGYAAIVVGLCFAALGCVQWLKRKSLKKVDPALWVLGALYVILAVLYVLFEKFIVNYRPVLMPGEMQPEASFPSSHTMLFCVILGSTALVLGRYIRNPLLLRGSRIVCAALVGVGVVLRLFSGVHWFTDIVGGVLISAALLLFFSAVLDQCK